MVEGLVRALGNSMREELETALREAAEIGAPTDLVRAMYGSLCSIRERLEGEDEFTLRSAINRGAEQLVAWKGWKREDERRQGERVPARDATVRLKLADEEAVRQFYLRDISCGGVFVCTKRPPQVGTPLTVFICMPDGTEISLRGRVAHARADESDGAHPAGMGIQFLDLTDAERQGIESYLARLSRRSTMRGAAPASPAESPGHAPLNPDEFAKADADPRPELLDADPAASEPVLADASIQSDPHIELLRRLFWLLAEGGIMGRPFREIFGVASDASPDTRIELYQRLAEFIDIDRPPSYLGPEERQAAARILALLRSLLRV
jgi:uncharacterized protein (TIGR02266 family)